MLKDPKNHNEMKQNLKLMKKLKKKSFPVAMKMKAMTTSKGEVRVTEISFPITINECKTF